MFGYRISKNGSHNTIDWTFRSVQLFTKCLAFIFIVIYVYRCCNEELIFIEILHFYVKCDDELKMNGRKGLKSQIFMYLFFFFDWFAIVMAGRRRFVRFVRRTWRWFVQLHQRCQSHWMQVTHTWFENEFIDWFIDCFSIWSNCLILFVGFEMPSWFDLKTLDMYGPEDEDGIKKATANVMTMIQSEISAGIPANRIIVGGFSQGGALALHTGLTTTHALGGIVGLSCWLPLHKSFPDARKTADTVPIFQCHGVIDPVVPYKFGQLSHYSLKTFMKNAQFNSYPRLSHSSSPDEMNDLKAFIEKYVPPQ